MLWRRTARQGTDSRMWTRIRLRWKVGGALMLAAGLAWVFGRPDVPIRTAPTPPKPVQSQSVPTATRTRTAVPSPVIAVPNNTREIARSVLDRPAPSNRAGRARTVRRELGELRNQLGALERNSPNASIAHLAATQRALSDAYWGESGDRSLLPADSDAAIRMEVLIDDLAAITSSRAPATDDLQRIIEEIGAALEAPDAEVASRIVLTPLVAAADQ